MSISTSNIVLNGRVGKYKPKDLEVKHTHMNTEMIYLTRASFPEYQAHMNRP
jgi:hypothetical protein